MEILDNGFGKRVFISRHAEHRAARAADSWKGVTQPSRGQRPQVVNSAGAGAKPMPAAAGGRHQALCDEGIGKEVGFQGGGRG